MSYGIVEEFEDIISKDLYSKANHNFIDNFLSSAYL